MTHRVCRWGLECWDHRRCRKWHPPRDPPKRGRRSRERDRKRDRSRRESPPRRSDRAHRSERDPPRKLRSSRVEPPRKLRSSRVEPPRLRSSRKPDPPTYHEREIRRVERIHRPPPRPAPPTYYEAPEPAPIVEEIVDAEIDYENFEEQQIISQEIDYDEFEELPPRNPQRNPKHLTRPLMQNFLINPLQDRPLYAPQRPPVNFAQSYSQPAWPAEGEFSEDGAYELQWPERHPWQR